GNGSESRHTRHRRQPARPSWGTLHLARRARRATVDGGALSAPHLLDQIADGAVYVVRDAGTLAGSVTMTHEDPNVWGHSPTRAGYLHRLMVDRDYADRRLGARLINWCEEEVRRRHMNTVRLDCGEANITLRR
ncbi:MAG TPA: GNAT family N-acetyltransferase, partial [Acidimicrobiales bacterium]|nr:GNAT family N-acetyltransferase [Acidimicrobiales bacterium]